MHGAITSISYGIPHMALTNKISKLIDFLETWKTTPIIYTSMDDISNNVEKLLNMQNDIETNTKIREKLFEQSDNNFNEIVNLIKEQIVIKK